jgi:hypothetical protein
MDGLTDEVFVTPPAWPRPPSGWVPPPAWRPDPKWPPPPPGWQFWQTVTPAGTTEPDTGKLRSENAALRREIRRLEQAVEASNAELRRVLGTDPAVVRAETERMLRDRDTAQIQLRTALAQLDAIHRRV